MAPSPSSLAGSCKDDIQHISIPSVSKIIRQISTSGIAVAVATAVTHPIDVYGSCKVDGGGSSNYLHNSIIGCCQSSPADGIRWPARSTDWNGLAPALLRSFVYGGLRLGLYEPCKYVSDAAFGYTGIMTNFASGAFSGALATALTNPTEILKIRLQMKKGSGSKGSVHELSHIVATEGITGLWKGVGPAMTRAAALTASQLATYDESKQVLTRWTSLKEGFFLHLSASTIAGIMGTLATAPIDTIKTRLMMQRESARIGIYKNGFHCAYKVMLSEGLQGLYKGGTALFARLGPQTAITFLVYEKMREFTGMKAL
ncbi:uncharacterized protein LOC131037955 isoform X1 [Cryptomeria japonica]|uniref:uncharacterized protein LOC131037955 isoform X1 n=1 Tax=Cryptomeria japonica TaxID=3369 RepID=UPI0025AC70E6|nr:uncharacterized protein LOC131037955 isoform X1 [Cryptomeria japonica]